MSLTPRMFAEIAAPQPANKFHDGNGADGKYVAIAEARLNGTQRGMGLGA